MNRKQRVKRPISLVDFQATGKTICYKYQIQLKLLKGLPILNFYWFHRRKLKKYFYIFAFKVSVHTIFTNLCQNCGSAK